MNSGLLLRAARESLGLTLLCAIGIAFFQVVFSLILPILAEDLSENFLRTRFARFFLSAMLGTKVDAPGPELFAAIGWVHPVQLALLLVHAFASATRVPAGEVDRGTIDLLLGWPVSRAQVFLAELVVFAAGSACIVLCAVLGAFAGFALNGVEGAPSLLRFLVVATNLYALALAVGGLVWICSARAERRGRAIALPLAIFLLSMMINFFAPLWEPARVLSGVSLLSYYQPMAIFTRGALPLEDLAILFGFAAVTLFGAGLLFARRDLRAA